MDYYLGQILLFPYSFQPEGFMLCNGAVLPIQQYTALFSLIGTKFGGNGATNFALPNLEDLSPIPGMKYYIASMGIYPARD